MFTKTNNMKTKDFITVLIIMLFIGAMLTSCRKQEKRVLGEWIGQDLEGVNVNVEIRKDGYSMWKNGDEIEFCLSYIEDNNLVCERTNSIHKTPYAVRNGHLYIWGLKLKRNN
jgi:hypothetical protein